MATAHLQSLPPQAAPGFAQQLRRVGAAVSAVPSSPPPFWIAYALTLIVAHYQLWGRLNIAYKVLGVVVILMAIFAAGLARMLGRPQVLCLLTFQLVMIVNMALGRFYDLSACLQRRAPRSFSSDSCR
jgi:hypothetical protein